MTSELLFSHCTTDKVSLGFICGVCRLVDPGLLLGNSKHKYTVTIA